jgi:hypothetical protein
VFNSGTVHRYLIRHQAAGRLIREFSDAACRLVCRKCAEKTEGQFRSSAEVPRLGGVIRCKIAIPRSKGRWVLETRIGLNASMSWQSRVANL